LRSRRGCYGRVSLQEVALSITGIEDGPVVVGSSDGAYWGTPRWLKGLQAIGMLTMGHPLHERIMSMARFFVDVPP